MLYFTVDDVSKPSKLIFALKISQIATIQQRSHGRLPLTQSEQFQQFCAPSGPFLSCLALDQINKVLIYCSSNFSLLQVNLPLLIKLLSTPMLGYNRINGTLRQYLHSLYYCGIQITQFPIYFDLYLFYEHSFPFLILK